ncbi:uncharacterized protein LOC112884843 isoform X5 [Panicum hallii]|uniref:uncharacterized protein LOC112884843 isoform X5 n=1 Tax=Panicum hallii TaxID=206008 RepID=UPI000DF4DD70|nr:uncharacterized protein LOC112884843 isoform X5 [Panicum hallii]
MARNPGCTVFIGNLDDRVPERVLYEILIQISGQDKPSSNSNMPVTPRLNPVPAPKAPHLMRSSDTPASQQTVVNGRIAGYGISPSHSYDAHSQAPSSGLPSRGLSNGCIWKLHACGREFDHMEFERKSILLELQIAVYQIF